MNLQRLHLPIAACCLFVGLLSAVASAGAGEMATIDFATQIAPIFVEHCYACHGPDKQESGLHLDVRDAALHGGDSGPLLVAGQSKASALVGRITALDDERMPPDGARNTPLTPAQVQTIAAWIDQGAAWPESNAARSNHWAFQPIVRPGVPTVRAASWARGELDRFVLAKLEERGLSPAPEADRYTLIKRLSYDLIGLPPSIEEVDAFAHDTSADAYERVVDRLLASPHFGERWGRHWLDMARFADSDGYEKDNPRPDAWRYRDWVIEAINRDLPLDRFTIEQLAGDLLPAATADQRLATAFHRQTLTNTEGGADPEQFRVEAIFDRIATTGSVWLGLTVGCAECHTHKYDPITHREYYQLFAFFDNGDEVENDVPLVGEPLAQWRTDREQAETQLAKSRPKLDALRAKLTGELAKWEADLQVAQGEPLQFHPIELLAANSAAGAEIKLLSDGSYLLAGKSPDVDKLSIQVRCDLDAITGLRIEVLVHPSLPGGGPGRSEGGNFVLSEARLSTAAGAGFNSPTRVALRLAQADFAQDGFLAAAAIDDKEASGWAVAPQTGRNHALLLIAKDPIRGSATPYLQIELTQNHGLRHTLGRVRVTAITGHDPLLGIPPAVREILTIKPAARTAQQSQSLAEYYIGQDKAAKKLSDEVAKLEERAKRPPLMKARVIAERTTKPRTSHVLRRGDFLQPEEEVACGTLAVLPPLKTRAERANRLDLAKWLVAPDNPLVRRVMVNQLWSYLFGRGIVRTANDFGVRGERPTHPELLDALACELVERGWSRKEMIRLIVSSATYRQESSHRETCDDADPLNDLFHRQNRYRVDGEIVRDLTLAVGGLLSDRLGGPSVFPPLPADIAALSYANNFKWNTSEGANRYRRGMYTFFKRTAPHPNLTTFDCPDANTTCIERQASNTPLQALTALNNECFAEAAQAMAARVLRAGGSDADRLTLALRWCVARPPMPDELDAFGALLAASRAWYAEHSGDASAAIGQFRPADASPQEAAAWVATVRMMLNLDEFLTRS